ncbi:MAG: hypothetical protein ACI841_003518 [Planctomycetota bacterium]|jgi:hypothetical protein
MLNVSRSIGSEERTGPVYEILMALPQANPRDRAQSRRLGPRLQPPALVTLAGQRIDSARKWRLLPQAKAGENPVQQVLRRRSAADLVEFVCGQS